MDRTGTPAAMTFKILTDDSKNVIYRSEVRSTLDHNMTNFRIDNIFDDKTTSVFVKSMKKGVSAAAKATGNELANAAPTDGCNGERINSTPECQPSDLIGRTFFMDTQPDGQKFRAAIVEAITQHQ